MGPSPRSRTRQSSGQGKGPLKGARELDSRRLTRTTSQPSLSSPTKPLSPAASAFLETAEQAPQATQHESGNGLEDIAPEIVVWTEEMDSMIVDSPETATPATPAPEEKAMYVLVPTCPWLLINPFPLPAVSLCILQLLLAPSCSSQFTYRFPASAAFSTSLGDARILNHEIALPRPSLRRRRRRLHRCRSPRKMGLPKTSGRLSLPRSPPSQISRISRPFRPLCRARLPPLSMPTARERRLLLSSPVRASRPTRLGGNGTYDLKSLSLQICPSPSMPFSVSRLPSRRGSTRTRSTRKST